MAVFILQARGYRRLFRSLLILFVFTFINLFLLKINFPTTQNEGGGVAQQDHQQKNTTHFVLFAAEGLLTLSTGEGGSSEHGTFLLNFTKVDLTRVDGNELFQNRDRLSSSLSDMFATNWKDHKPLCPAISSKLVGWTKIPDAAFILEEKKDIVEYKLIQSGVTAGGRYEPSECRARHKIAVIVPVRKRTQHLTIFSRYMHPFLQRQQLNYVIVVVEQSRGSPFNRGMLLNVGYKEALLQDQQIQCFFFHDVDMLPEHDGNPYTCPEDGQPRLMTFSLDNWDNYKPTPDWYFGGVTAFSTGDFQKVNGFSNVFWGWGGEDNDLLQRVEINNMTVTRTLDKFPSLIHMARYKTLAHRKAEANPDRFLLLEEGPKRIASDGLADLKYKTIDLQLKLLYTHIFVDIQQPHQSTDQ